ncbi:MAG: hypothetical protein NT033_10275 [Candidatus Omnitrophica bacterium]|nr:hypothetical protein [Candidatus Omnitrophota bacterium]
MKLTRKVFFGLAVLGIIVFLSGVSFAENAPAAGIDASARKAKHEARIKVLQDSAVALQQTSPDLAKKLSDLVNEDANESKEKVEAGKEKIAKDSPEWKAKHDARVQLFKDAAAALQQTHPDLAKSLEEMTVAKHKTDMQKTAGEKNEKEEAGEKAEPKGDK